MKTTQEKPLSKEKLMDVATELMLEKGYVATTIDEICDQAELTKGGFFHYFDSKEDLAKALLTRQCSSHQKTKEEMFGSDPLKRVFGLIDMMIQGSKKPGGAKGCLKGTLAHELSDTHPEIRRICSDAFKMIAQDFARDLAEAKAQYAPEASFIPQSVAEHFISVIQGSYILAKTHQNPKIVAQDLEHFKKYVECLLGQ